jgi:hypothetical protein
VKSKSKLTLALNNNKFLFAVQNHSISNWETFEQFCFKTQGSCPLWKENLGPPISPNPTSAASVFKGAIKLFF